MPGGVLLRFVSTSHLASIGAPCHDLTGESMVSLYLTQYFRCQLPRIALTKISMNSFGPYVSNSIFFPLLIHKVPIRLFDPAIAMIVVSLNSHLWQFEAHAFITIRVLVIISVSTDQSSFEL